MLPLTLLLHRLAKSSSHIRRKTPTIREKTTKQQEGVCTRSEYTQDDGTCPGPPETVFKRPKVKILTPVFALGSAVMACVHSECRLEGEEHLGSNSFGGYIFVKFCPVPRHAFFCVMPIFRVRRRGQVHARQVVSKWNEKANSENFWRNGRRICGNHGQKTLISRPGFMI